MSVPSCKGTPLQGCGRPWYTGYGTAQEQRTLAIWSIAWRSTNNNDRKFMQSWPSAIILQSTEVYFKLSSQLQLMEWMLRPP